MERILSFYGEKEEKRGRAKRELVGMAKDFNFQLLVIYVMFKLTIHVTSNTTTTDFAQNYTATKLG